jgi:alpha-beta hydrolase superfamily lysophospholipase
MKFEIAAALAATLLATSALAQTPKLATDEMMVNSPDPGIEIYVRNKRPTDMTSFRPERTLLYVHGATYPASTAFDLPLDGQSWMDYIAARGYDVYLLDIRGYAPGWIRQNPSITGPQVAAGPLGAYRTVTREMAMQRWMTGVPEDKKATLIPAGWFDAWANATWATDPVGAQASPPVIRAPNGVVADSNEYWFAGKAYYDPVKITVPTLLVQAEWDRDLPPYMAQTLFPLLISSPGKRYVMLPEGTHTVMMEKNRRMLFEAVQAFLDEAGRT